MAALTACGEPALTIYNQNFAVVRDMLTLDLERGVNQVVMRRPRRTWSRIR